MRGCCATKMRTCRRMKFLCIISGCPAGARKWHILIFAMLLHSKITPQVALWGYRLCDSLWDYSRSSVLTQPRSVLTILPTCS